MTVQLRFECGRRVGTRIYHGWPEQPEDAEKGILLENPRDRFDDIYLLVQNSYILPGGIREVLVSAMDIGPDNFETIFKYGFKEEVLELGNDHERLITEDESNRLLMGIPLVLVGIILALAALLVELPSLPLSVRWVLGLVGAATILWGIFIIRRRSSIF